MKKYLFLTIALALAACGGNGGSYIGNMDDFLSDAGSQGNLSSALGASNLKSVTFDSGTGTHRYTFVGDGKKISQLKDYDSYTGQESLYQLDGNRKTQKILGEDISVDANGTVEMMGKAAGLRFSDFGYLNAEIIYARDEDGNIYDSSMDTVVLAGGLADKEIKNVAEGTTFTGRAVAKVSANTIEGDKVTIKSDVFTTENAKLYFVNGEETLLMDFSTADNPWYQVTMTNDRLILNKGIRIRDDMFKVKAEDENIQLDDVQNMYLNVKYFGTKGNVTETVGNAGFTRPGIMETDDVHHNINLESAFGGTIEK